MESIKQYTIDYFYQVKNQLEQEKLLFNLNSLDQELQEKIILISSEFDSTKGQPSSTFKPEEWRKKKPAHLLQKVGQTQEEMIVKKINQDLNKISDNNWETIIESIKYQYQDLQQLIYQFDQTSMDQNHISEEINNRRKTYLLPILENIYTKSKIQPLFCPYYIKLLLQIPDQEFIRLFIEEKKNLYLRMIHIDLASQVENTQWQLIEKNRRKKRKHNFSPIHSNSQIKLDSPSENSIITNLSITPGQDYDLFCQANKIKICQQGASQFMGELFKVDKTIFSPQEIYYCYQQFYNNINGIIQDQSELSNIKIDSLDENILYFTSLVEYTLDETLLNFSIEELKDFFDKLNLLSDDHIIPGKQRFKIKDLFEYFEKKIKNSRRKIIKDSPTTKEYKKTSRERI